MGLLDFSNNKNALLSTGIDRTICELMTLTFDLGGYRDCRSYTRLGTLSEYQVHILVILRLFVFDLWALEPTWRRMITWPCDLDLWPWRSWRLWLMRVVVLHPYTKFEVHIGLAFRKIWRTMCVSINGPGDPNLWPFDLETGIMRVASKVGNLPSKFGHVRPLGSRIIRYVRDGRTDKSNAYCPLPIRGRWHNNGTHVSEMCPNCSVAV